MNKNQEWKSAMKHMKGIRQQPHTYTHTTQKRTVYWFVFSPFTNNTFMYLLFGSIVLCTPEVFLFIYNLLSGSVDWINLRKEKRDIIIFSLKMYWMYSQWPIIHLL